MAYIQPGEVVHHLLVDSHERQDVLNTSNYDYKVGFGADHTTLPGGSRTSVNDVLRNVVNISVLEAHIPNTVYNVQAPFNKLLISMYSTSTNANELDKYGKNASDSGGINGGT